MIATLYTGHVTADVGTLKCHEVVARLFRSHAVPGGDDAASMRARQKWNRDQQPAVNAALRYSIFAGVANFREFEPFSRLNTPPASPNDGAA
jgi:hypothetical protein